MSPFRGKRAGRFAVLVQSTWLLLFTALCIWTPNEVSGYTPDSEEVRAMLSRAISYLEKTNAVGEGEMLGGQCLMGLAVYKYNKRFGQQPTALPALTQKALARALGDTNKLRGEDNYSVGIALIFLCEVHPQRHMDAINVYLEEMKNRQKDHGGWGYGHEKTGDLSQLQYAVLGLWAAKNVGLQVSDKMMADVVNYVIRVQDPSGAWGYQGNDPGGFQRVAQSQIRPSLVAAGLGSLFVGADFLGMSKTGKPRTISKKKLPPALIPVIESDDRPGRSLAGNVDSGRLKQSMKDGEQWFSRQSSLKTNRYQYYFLYGLERFQSFKELVEGTYEEEPRWYNDGVRLLREYQSERDGSWGVALTNTVAPTGTSPAVATSFAVLFLLRSTRDTVEQAMDRDGLLRGGYGLPSDLTEIRIRGNQIVAPAITGEVADLISMLEDEDGEKIESMLENPDALSLSGMTGSGREFTARLSRILRTGQYKARIVAARTLGRQGDLDNVPVLIYALSDPDPRVVAEARDGLRLTSRKFDGFGLSDKPTPGQVRTVVNQWKAWYKSIRPDAIFIQ